MNASVASLNIDLFNVGALSEFPHVLVALAPFLFVICIIAIKAVRRYSIQRLRHETIRMAIEKGQPLPSELLHEECDRRPRDDRKSGLILIAVGIGVGLFLHFNDYAPQARDAAWVAAIPGLIGVALLINWALNRNGASGRGPQS